MTDIRRRLRATLRNTVLWGVGWTVLGFATQMVLRLAGIIHAPASVPEVAIIALKVGVGGGIAGAAFSAYIAFAYRHRRLQEISWLRFGLLGAVVTALSITGFVQGASLLGGGGLVPWRYMESTLAMFALFGFGVAALSMKVAQLAAANPPGSAEVPLEDEWIALGGRADGATTFEEASHAEARVRRE